MSHIFDALQRSETEFSGVDLSTLSGATELLRHAERRAVSKWETEVISEQPDGMKSADRDMPFGRQTAPQIAMESEAPSVTEPPLNDEHLGLFSQFHSLQVTLTPQSRLVCLTDSENPAAEAFRLLGVRLRHLRRSRPLKKVLITSTIPQEGKSMVAANLACTLALRTQQRTLLLEGDLRRPSLSQMFGLGRNPGLSEWLQGEHSLVTSIYYLEDQNLWILPAGGAPSNAQELMQSGKLSALMDQLALLFDWIIIDSPPVLPLADTSVWMRVVDGILLITRQGTTEKRKLLRGIEALEPKKLIGALANGSKNATDSDYYYSPATVSRQNEATAR